MNGKIVADLAGDFSHGGIITQPQGQLMASWQNGLGQSDLATQNFSVDVAISSNSFPTTYTALDITYAGYTPLGIVGYYVSDRNFRFLQRYVDGNTCYFNLSCNQQYINVSSVNVKMTILYMKNY